MTRSALWVLVCFTALLSLVPKAARADYVRGVAFDVPVTRYDEKSDEKADAAAPAKDAGSIDGQVIAVDYGTGTISVKAANARYEIVVLPSTSIQGHGNNNFHTIADIHKGARVQVIMSRKSGTYTAQIIRLY